jgi:hypothetical protein
MVTREGAAGRPVSQETSRRPPSRYALAKGVALLIGNKFLAVCGATVTGVMALLLASSALAGSGAPATVTVRIEGLSKQLLSATKVATHTGSITKNGTPKGSCPATSAAGALDLATHHNWSGKYDKSFGLEVISILGEAHSFSSKDFWEIFVNNVAAESGACELKLHSGERLLFAAVPDKGPTEYPIALEVPSHAVAGSPFTGKVVYYNAKGKATPLAGATVTVNGHSSKTGTRGTIKLSPGSAGTFVFTATKTGYIPAAPVAVSVTS